MTIDFSTLLVFCVTVVGLFINTVVSRMGVIRTSSLLLLSLLLAQQIYVYWPLSASQGGLYGLGIFMILGNLLACFYTPAHVSSRTTFSLILMLNMLAFVILRVESTTLLGAFIPVFFLLLLVATGTRYGMHRLLLVFGGVASLLLMWSLLSHGEQRLNLELLGLVFFIGLFPVSPWYSRLFETLPSGLLASSFVFQVMLVMSLEQQQAIPRDTLMFILPVLAIISLLMALAQSSARRALSGIAASQLAFLVYADSGQHFSELSALLMAQAQTVAVAGLILTVGTLETRVGELNISRPSGQYDSYPKLASAMLLFGLMGAGFPLTLAYIAEDLVLESGFHEAPLLGMIWLLVTALTAIAVIKMYLYLCHGRKGFEPGIDILPSKLIAAVLSILLLIFSSFSLAA